MPDFDPYLPTIVRLALALGLGLFVGMEREWRRKEAGLRTFAFVSLLGALGGVLGSAYALAALGLVGILVAFLNLRSLSSNQELELTTSAALLVTTFTGILAGMGGTFTPAAIAIVSAGLLAWKEPLAGFTVGLTVQELRSAILFAILAFVIYPILPDGTIDPWGLVNPQTVWGTIILIAGIGFVNYVLLKVYGSRGVRLTGLFGGFVNSSVAVAELANLHRRAGRVLGGLMYEGVLLATGGTMLRNIVVLALLAPAALSGASLSFVLMLALTIVFVLLNWRQETVKESEAPPINLKSPISMKTVLTFGLVFLSLEVIGTLAQRLLGEAGFYAVSLVGGVVSSASAIATAGTLAANGTLTPTVAGTGAVLASLTSTIVNFTLAARVSDDRQLTRRLALSLGSVMAIGVLGVLVPPFIGPLW